MKTGLSTVFFLPREKQAVLCCGTRRSAEQIKTVVVGQTNVQQLQRALQRDELFQPCIGQRSGRIIHTFRQHQLLAAPIQAEESQLSHIQFVKGSTGMNRKKGIVRIQKDDIDVANDRRS